MYQCIDSNGNYRYPRHLPWIFCGIGKSFPIPQKASGRDAHAFAKKNVTIQKNYEEKFNKALQYA